MIPLEPGQIAELWEADGSLRDIYARPMTIDAWRSFLALVTKGDFLYTVDGEHVAVPDAAAIFNDRTRSHLLTLRVEGVQVNCHFFTDDELELDIDPGEVVAARAHAAVLRFLETVAAAIGRPLSVTPENMSAQPHLSFEPSGARWTWHETGRQEG